MGLSESKALPTIVVFVDPEVLCDLSILEIDIAKMLATPVSVEFIPGELPGMVPTELEQPGVGHPGVFFLDRMVDRETKLQMG